MSPHIRAHLSKYLVALSLCIFAVFVVGVAGCVTPQDTQEVADTHKKLDAEREDVAAKLAAGLITQQEAVERLQRALDTAKDEIAAVGKRVSERTTNLFENPTSILGVIASNVLTGIGTNFYRTSREEKKWGTPEEAEAELESLKAQIRALQNNANPLGLAAPTS